MKTDYKYIKSILETIENFSSHKISHSELLNKIQINLKGEEGIDYYMGHIKLLKDSLLIEVETAKGEYGFYPDIGGNQCIEGFIRLTLAGSEFLNSLKDDTFMNKIKGFSISIAVEAGKQFLIAASTKSLGL